jgi:hypothetical protein
MARAAGAENPRARELEVAVKFLADDDRFGIVVTPAGWRHMYQFRLVIGGRLIGDAEPCIIGSAMMRLGSLTTLSDPRLSLALTDPAALVRLVAYAGGLDIESGEGPGSADTDLHDGTVLSLAESLDSWLVLGFRHDRGVVFLASYRAGGALGPVTAVIEPPVYDSLVEMARVYWAKLEAAAGPGYGPSPARGS